MLVSPAAVLLALGAQRDPAVVEVLASVGLDNDNHLRSAVFRLLST